ncbi:MAG TPA: DUF4893 domain-containing protein [Allosphingosinicella sp.]|nr:DUF4893 domain-containing protein [Allosphingosinicella sp.]
MIRLAFLTVACGSTLSACAIPQEPVPAARAAASWRNVATEDDRERLRNWRTVWLKAIERARAAGHAGELAQEGVLLDPDAGLTEPLPPPGDYDCRTIKVGSQGASGLDYVAYPAFRCRIGSDDGVVTFTKLSGSQRPIGVILPDTDRRSIFLGTLQLGDETGALQYGRDRERDMAALVERIGERRWRLAFPSPHFESLLDVLELTPRSP